MSRKIITFRPNLDNNINKTEQSKQTKQTEQSKQTKQNEQTKQTKQNENLKQSKTNELIKKNLNTEIYWENLNQQYKIDDKLKYCIFINGCFGPPHRGHIESIKKSLQLFGSNCKIIINQLAFTGRHGVPNEYSKELMELYISKVFKNNPNIKLLYRASNPEIFKHDFVLKSNILIIIRGDEIFDLVLSKNNNLENINNINNINNKHEQKFNKIITYLNKKNIKVDFIFQHRPKSEISASKFIKLIIDYKQKKLDDKLTLEDLYELYFMIPEEIDLKKKNDIIKKLSSFNLFIENHLNHTNSTREKNNKTDKEQKKQHKHEEREVDLDSIIELDL